MYVCTENQVLAFRRYCLSYHTTRHFQQFAMWLQAWIDTVLLDVHPELAALAPEALLNVLHFQRLTSKFRLTVMYRLSMVKSSAVMMLLPSRQRCQWRTPSRISPTGCIICPCTVLGTWIRWEAIRARRRRRPHRPGPHHHAPDGNPIELMVGAIDSIGRWRFLYCRVTQ